MAGTGTSVSTVTLQSVWDSIIGLVDIKAVLTLGGYGNNLLQTVATDVMEAICACTFPWKWNEFNLPLFYGNSWQQDYALVLPNGQSVTNLAWLTDGVAIQINNSSTPKPWSWVEVGRRQGRSTATVLSNSFFAFPQFTASFLPNNLLYYGTWGAAQINNATWGNNPQPNQVITNPLGNGNSQPSNPITQIQDANGNLLVVTTYGTTGSTAPVLSAGSAAGTTVTDGSVVWTVVDPYGQGIRVKPIPSQTGVVWQFNLVGQMKPQRFTGTNAALSTQYLAPLTDEYENMFRNGVIAQLWKYSAEAKVRQRFDDDWNRWTKSVESLSLQSSKQKADRERDEDRFIPENSVMGAGAPRVGWVGSAWPYGYPIT
jgi:hypothetical protein